MLCGSLVWAKTEIEMNENRKSKKNFMNKKVRTSREDLNDLIRKYKIDSKKSASFI